MGCQADPRDGLSSCSCQGPPSCVPKGPLPSPMQAPLSWWGPSAVLQSWKPADGSVHPGGKVGGCFRWAVPRGWVPRHTCTSHTCPREHRTSGRCGRELGRGQVGLEQWVQRPRAPEQASASGFRTLQPHGPQAPLSCGPFRPFLSPAVVGPALGTEPQHQSHDMRQEGARRPRLLCLLPLWPLGAASASARAGTEEKGTMGTLLGRAEGRAAAAPGEEGFTAPAWGGLGRLAVVLDVTKARSTVLRAPGCPVGDGLFQEEVEAGRVDGPLGELELSGKQRAQTEPAPRWEGRVWP